MGSLPPSRGKVLLGSNDGSADTFPARGEGSHFGENEVDLMILFS